MRCVEAGQGECRRGDIDSCYCCFESGREKREEEERDAACAGAEVEDADLFWVGAEGGCGE